MMAYIYLFVGLLFVSMLVQSPSSEEQQNLQSYAYALSASMEYYHAEAQINCSVSGNCKTQQMISGLPSREGATNLLQYGNVIKSWTDGSSYIATTVCGANVGKAHMSEIYGWMRGRILETSNNRYSLGHWNGSVIVMDTIGDNTTGLTLAQPTYPLAYNPCGSLFMNQPIIYTRLY